MSNIFIDVELTTVNPITFIQHSRTGLPTIARGVNEDGTYGQTVYWPSAAFRSILRHGAATAELRKTGGTLGDAYLLALGQDLKPDADEDAQDLIATAAEREAAHPIVELFGTWKMASRLIVSNFLPAQNMGVSRMSFIRRDLDSDIELFDALKEEDRETFYARQNIQANASTVSAQMKVVEKELGKARRAKQSTEELDKKLAELKLIKEATKGEDKSENSKHLLEVECIPAGVTLHGRIVIERAKDRDVDLIMAGFEALSKRPMMGGNIARGFGEITGQATFKDDSKLLKKISFGGWKSAQLIDFSDTSVTKSGA